jgi:uncharacterized membrane protein YkgB
VSRNRRGRLIATARDAERAFLSFVERYSLQFLRYSLVVVFLWFGVLTAAGVGDVPALVAAAFGVVPTDIFVAVLGVWEIAIGAALLHRRTVRLGVVMVAVHTAVTTVPLATFPGETFAYFPYGPSFEGVFIVKNWVLLGGGMTVGGAID